MHEKHEFQLSLIEAAPVYPKINEYKQISKILDQKSHYTQSGHQRPAKRKKRQAQEKGMTAEQVVRATIIKHTKASVMKTLSVSLLGSGTFGEFCKTGLAMKSFKKSALQQNMKALSPETREKINKQLPGYVRQEKFENGRKVRIDCTVVASDIYIPPDSELVRDVVRVFTRILREKKNKIEGLKFSDTFHTRRATLAAGFLKKPEHDLFNTTGWNPFDNFGIR